MSDRQGPARRARGEGGVYFDASRNRWVATKTVGYDDRGKPIRKTGSGTSQSAALRSLRERIKEHEKGIGVQTKSWTVRQAVEDWLEHGQRQVGPKTIEAHVYACEHITRSLGDVLLRNLKAAHVERLLASLAATHATATLQKVRWCFHQVVRRAMARDLVDRNVVTLVDVPRGRVGRPSKALSMDQALAVLTETKGDPLYPYIVVSLLAGLRTEEVRALRWDHLHLEREPPTVDVWRSVRVGGDTKTDRSRRSLVLPALVVATLRVHMARQRDQQGARWVDDGYVFATTNGTTLDAANVRRSFRTALGKVPGIDPAEWTPRELRHSFVSLMSAQKVPLEEIARLVGHAGTKTTESVYRHELRPAIEAGAVAMDALFEPEAIGPGWHMEPLFRLTDVQQNIQQRPGSTVPTVHDNGPDLQTTRSGP